MFTSQLFTLALLATGALAAPRSNLSKRLERRNARGSRLLEGRETHAVTLAGNTSHVDYSSNWSGAVYESVRILAYTL
jgi:hypothetical protein